MALAPPPAGSPAAPTATPPPPPPPTYTQSQVDASLAANPNASTGGYQGPAMPAQYSGGQAGSGTATAAAAPASSYSLANDPAWLIAQNWQKQQNAFAQSQLGLDSSGGSSAGYTSQSGVKSAQLQYQLAQQQDAAQQAQAAHQLPITLLGIANQLAAHGVGNSGDATYLPGEAKYAYDNVIQGLQMDLSAKAAQVQLAQSDYAAASAANASQASTANANKLAQAQLNYQQAIAANNKNLQDVAVNLYQTAVQNGTALDPQSLSLLKSLAGG